MGAGTLVALGAAEMIWYAAASDRTDKSYLVYNGALLAGLGLITFFVEKEPESELREYREWNNKETTQSASRSFRWGVLPTPDGAVAAVSFRF